ncbi:MAG: type II secretion system F family protein [Gemmataceae bacterium]
MTADSVTIVSGFLAASSMVFLIFMLVSGRKSRLESRLDSLSNGDANQLPQPEEDAMRQLARSALPKMGAPLMPQNQEERTRLQARLYQAGLYSRQAMLFFLGVKMLIIVVPPVVGLIAGIVGLVGIREGMIVGAILGAFGLIGPSFWLDRRKKWRQTSFRRSLPDALDVLVICLEGGLSLAAALRKVAGELRTAHPVLALELNIVQREIQLGRSSGEALREFANRSDLEEVRSLASLIIQTEKFGASLVKALRVHGDTLRQKRLFYAEEMAQKAATKVLFPTVLCILPCVFIVILGPAMVQILAMFSNMAGMPK